MARRSSVLPRARRPMALWVAARSAARPMGFACRNRRHADRNISGERGDRCGDRYGSRTEDRQFLGHLPPSGLRQCDPPLDDHLAWAIPVDRSKSINCRRRISECADARFRSAKLDLVAHAVDTAAASARSNASHAAVTACRVVNSTSNLIRSKDTKESNYAGLQSAVCAERRWRFPDKLSSGVHLCLASGSRLAAL